LGGWLKRKRGIKEVKKENEKKENYMVEKEEKKWNATKRRNER